MKFTKHPEYDVAYEQGRVRNFKSIYSHNHTACPSTCCELCCVNENDEIMGIHHKIITLHGLKISLTKQLFLAASPPPPHKFRY